MKKRRGSISVRAVWAIPILAAITLVLGVWGCLSRGLGLDNSLYDAVGLINNANDQFNQGPMLGDWHIRVARWTGVVVLFSTALVAVGSLLQQRVSTTVARRTKQSAVIIGADPLATTAFEAAQRAGKSSLWLGAPAFDAPRSGSSPCPGRRRAGAAVIDYAGRSEHILVAEQDDADALVLARAARAAAPEGLHHRADARRAPGRGRRAPPSTRPAPGCCPWRRSRPGRSTIAHPPFLIAKERSHERIHALIVGFGQTGQAIARDLIVNCRTTYLDLPRHHGDRSQGQGAGGRPAGPRAGDRRLRRFAVHRRRDQRPGGPPGPEGDRQGASPRPDRSPRPMSASPPTPRRCRRRRMLQSLLRSIDLDRAADLRARCARPTPSPRPAGRSRPRRPDPLRRSGLDHHRQRVPVGHARTPPPAPSARPTARRCRAEQRDDPANRSARPWDELDETYRQANRDAVAHIPAKLASAGVDPGRWRWVTGPAAAGGRTSTSSPRHASWRRSPTGARALERPAAHGRLALGRSEVEKRGPEAAPVIGGLRRPGRRREGIRPRLRPPDPDRLPGRRSLSGCQVARTALPCRDARRPPSAGARAWDAAGRSGRPAYCRRPPVCCHPKPPERCWPATTGGGAIAEAGTAPAGAAAGRRRGRRSWAGDSGDHGRLGGRLRGQHRRQEDHRGADQRQYDHADADEEPDRRALLLLTRGGDA